MSKAKIESILQEKFQPLHLNVVDDSHQHAGHNAAARHGGTHMTVVIVSESFTGKKLVERHRMVYEALQPLLAAGLHALAIQAKTPSEV